MKKFTQKILVAAVTLATTTMFGVTTMRPNMLLSAKLDCASATPSVAGNGVGVASFMLNANRDSLCINATFAGLTGSVTSAHIHNGAVGVAGGVALDLSSYVSGNKLSATITGTALTALLKSNMLKGLTYLNVHTAANAGGEIRGQILLESDWTFSGALNGANATPSVATAANGYAVFNLAKHSGVVKFWVVCQGLSGPITAAHLHFGAIGVAGGVAQDIGTYTVAGNPNVLMGSFTPSAGVTASLQAGLCYVNIHTTANGGGEIRAQVVTSDKIPFDAYMTSAQETPTIVNIPAAAGLTSLKLNTTFDTLWYYVYTTGLTGSITSAHLHNGAVGVAGGVAAAYATNTLSYFSGIITGTNLTTAIINNMLTGNIYSNIHTTANAGGEIRGQVWRVMREGFTYNMTGAQQVTPVVTSAIGSGIASIDRDQLNMHFMLATSGLSVTSIHFHKAIAGAAGGVIDDISGIYTNNSAFGYWKNTDVSPFTLQNSTQVNSDSVYVNAHTTANAGGEIRGQVWYGFNCYALPVGVNENVISENGFSIYPNPAKNTVSVNFYAFSNENVNVSVVDMVGKVISTNSYNGPAGENKLNIDLKNASTGMYFIKISNGKNEITKKLIVE